MSIVYILFALFILLIFNSMTHQFCLKMEMNQRKQSTVYRAINIMVTILLISSYVRVINVIA